jgi:protein TonB
MLTNLPPVLRLMLFLVLSAGLHGSAAFYDWTMAPAESRLNAVPVVVSLLPATEALPQTIKVKPLKAPVAAPVSKASRPAAKLKTAPPVEKIQKAAIEKTPVAEPLDKVLVESPAPEIVCATPQVLVPDSPVVEIAMVSETNEEDASMALLSSLSNKVFNEVSHSASSSLVEAVPNYRSNPLPEYPRLARRKHWQGVVWLLVDVSPDGLVDDLQVEETCGHKLLDRAAERTVKRWQFSPATRAGLPVSSQVRIPVRFRLEDG